MQGRKVLKSTIVALAPNVSGLCDGGASEYKCSINYKSQIDAEKFKYSTNAPLLQNPC